MTGQDVQDRLDALVVDLQTKGKGQTVQIMFRNPDNSPNVLPLSSNAQGVVDAAQLAAVQAFIDGLKPIATEYETRYEPVRLALEDVNTAKEPHQPLFDAAKVARKALADALTADANYQGAIATLEAERNGVEYIAAKMAFENSNVSENYSALSEAKGEYVSA